jgi:hypothetical protein
VSEEFVPNE